MKVAQTQSDRQKNLALLGLGAAGASTAAIMTQPAYAQDSNAGITEIQGALTAIGTVQTAAIALAVAGFAWYVGSRMVKRATR